MKRRRRDAVSSSSINSQLFQAKAGSIQNQADSSSIYSAGVWSFKNSTAVASVTITDAGNVGIGTASPSVPLDIVASNSTAFHLKLRGRASDSVGQMEFWNNTNTTRYAFIGADSSALSINSSGALPMTFGTNGAERMRIDASGLIIPGTPINTSTVASALTGRLNFTEGGVPGSQVATAIHWQTVQTAGNSGFRQHVSLGSIRSGGPDFGYMFIGVGQNDSAITTSFNFYGNGSAIQGNNSSTWSVASDARIKQNVRPVSSCLQKITALNPVHFEYIHKPEQIKTGFVAQEFEQVLPGHVLEAVCPLEVAELKPELKEEKIKAIDADLIPYLVGAIKELSVKNEALEARLAALESK